MTTIVVAIRKCSMVRMSILRKSTSEQDQRGSEHEADRGEQGGELT